MRAINYIIRDCKDNRELFNSLIPKYASNYLYYLNESYRAGVVNPAIDLKLKKLVRKIWIKTIKSDGLRLTTKISLLIFGASPAIYEHIYMIYLKVKNYYLRKVYKSI